MLAVHPLAEDLDTLRNPAFLGRRQQHLRFEASTAMTPPASGVAAGLAAFQSEAYWYFLGVRDLGGGASRSSSKRATVAAARGRWPAVKYRCLQHCA